MAFIMVCLEFTDYISEAGWLRPLIETGQLALTIYIAHVIVGLGFLEMIGRLENQTIQVVWLYSLGFWVATMIFAHLWCQHFRRGPLEWLMRTITQ